MKIKKTEAPGQKPDFNNLPFGTYFTDHMLVMDYENGIWQETQILPYGDFSLSPATSVLHYGQGIFEGLKAYKNEAGEIKTFRVRDNFLRMNRSAERMCIPKIDPERCIQELFELIRLDRDWVPSAAGTSLYIRPYIFATDDMIGVHASGRYRYAVILSPVGAYYKSGLAPVKIVAEEEYVRTFAGGTGEAKCMGNYAASLLASERAKKAGYEQVLWLDGKDHEYAEEVGSMNIFFVIGDEVVTPALTGSILPGITRASAIELLKHHGYKVSERRISMKEIAKHHKTGTLKEVFGTGTAAVVSPVGCIGYAGEEMRVGDGKMGQVTAFLYERLTGIQNGKYPDEFGWVYQV